MESARVGLGQLLLALDRTMVTLVEAPRGLDLPVGSVALVDSDDIRLGVAAGAGNADAFFLLGVSGDEALRWLSQKETVPTAIFVKEPAGTLVARASAAGVAVVAVEPRARWERLYRLVTHVLEHHGDRDDPQLHSGTDLFGLAQSIAERTKGMISIEDAQSHVLAYSASNDEADELRRLSILGRAGPPEHLEWISKWGIFDALRARRDVVRVAERPELGLRPRLAVGIHREASPDALRPSGSSHGRRRAPGFIGTIWLQQGSRPLADDVEDVLRGAAVLAARIMSRLAATPTTHALRVQELLGFAGDDVGVTAVARDLGIKADGRVALIGFRCADGQVPADSIALSASAFRPDAHTAAVDDAVYVLFPQTGTPSSVASWVRGTVGALDRELGLELRAVIAVGIDGLTAAAAARADVDRVFASAGRHPGAIRAVTSTDEARTTVLLDEIVKRVGDELVDPRLWALRDYDAEHDGSLLDTLRAYLDCFGDIAAASDALHVHPNTVRYRVRRIEKLLGSSLGDPDDRLVLGLGLRAMSLTATRPNLSLTATTPPRSARRSR